MGKLRNELEDIDDRDDVVDNIKYMSSIKRKIIKWCIVILVSTLIGGVCGWRIHAYFTKEDSLPTNYITAKLQDAAELTTQTMTYTSRVPATLRAGVDLSKAEVKERGDDKIVVKLPHAAIQGTPNIDPNSIEFMDEKKAILNWNKKEDVAEALAKAKEDFETNPSIDTTL